MTYRNLHVCFKEKICFTRTMQNAIFQKTLRLLFQQCGVSIFPDLKEKVSILQCCGSLWSRYYLLLDSWTKKDIDRLCKKNWQKSFYSYKELALKNVTEAAHAHTSRRILLYPHRQLSWEAEINWLGVSDLVMQYHWFGSSRKTVKLSNWWEGWE